MLLLVKQSTHNLCCIMFDRASYKDWDAAVFTPELHKDNICSIVHNWREAVYAIQCNVGCKVILTFCSLPY